MEHRLGSQCWGQVSLGRRLCAYAEGQGREIAPPALLSSERYHCKCYLRCAPWVNSFPTVCLGHSSDGTVCPRFVCLPSYQACWPWKLQSSNPSGCKIYGKSAHLIFQANDFEEVFCAFLCFPFSLSPPSPTSSSLPLPPSPCFSSLCHQGFLPFAAPAVHFYPKPCVRASYLPRCLVSRWLWYLFCQFSGQFLEYSELFDSYLAVWVTRGA